MQIQTKIVCLKYKQTKTSMKKYKISSPNGWKKLVATTVSSKRDENKKQQ